MGKGSEGPPSGSGRERNNDTQRIPKGMLWSACVHAGSLSFP